VATFYKATLPITWRSSVVVA